MKKHGFLKQLCCFLCLLVVVLNFNAFPVEVEFPLVQSMSYFPYADNSLLKKGEFSGTVDLYYSNVYMFNHQRTTLNDFEFFSTTVGVRYGLWEGGTLELYYRHSMIFGGILDKLIEDFHQAFNFPDTNRDEYPRFSVHYRYYDGFFYTENQSAASPLILAFLKELYSSSHFSLKTRLSLGIPLSDKPGFSSGKSSFSAGMVIGFKKKWLTLEFSNYLSFFKKPSWLADEDIRSYLFFSNLEANLGRFILGFTFRTSVFKEDDIAHHAYQGYIGFKITRYLEFIIIEDFVPFDTTPDISFYVRIKFQLK
ncbi:MAG: DUF3187 family protein [Candidatus Aminicenantes bacterium]|nr:MAG: DUF3187 family protein [Candidatus Aminicenantes bacterium]